MSDLWPDDDDLLGLVRESQEHKRAWALIAGLSKTIMRERSVEHPPHESLKPIGEKPPNWTDIIHNLEEKIVKQKGHIRTLEECRVFEAESERLLVGALERAVVHGGGTARLALDAHAERQGPRTSDA